MTRRIQGGSLLAAVLTASAVDAADAISRFGRGAGLLSPQPSQAGPAPKKIQGATSRALICVPECYQRNVDLEDGSIVKEVIHANRCPIALSMHNQRVNSRQVRRQKKKKA